MKYSRSPAPKRRTSASLVSVFVVALMASTWLSAAAAEWSFTVPASAIGFNFGPAKVAIPGLTQVGMGTVFSEGAQYGFNRGQFFQGGAGWPDPLTGTWIGSLRKRTCKFTARVPNGDYFVWLCAGKILRQDEEPFQYLLKLNDEVLFDESPTCEEYNGERYLHRFVWTQYSMRRHGIWEDYIDRMYPSSVHRVTVTDGTLSVVSRKHFISALVIVPARDEAAFEDMVVEIRRKRIQLFEDRDVRLTKMSVSRGAADGDYLVYAPEGELGIDPTLRPWSRPTSGERKRTGIRAAGAQGERVVLRLAVLPFADLGRCTLTLSDLTGPGRLPAQGIRAYFRSWTWSGPKKGVWGTTLLPYASLAMEAGITQCYWLFMTVPADAKPGLYGGTFTFKPQHGEPRDVPVEFEVYPFALDRPLPLSFGMWGIGPVPPFLSQEARLKLLTDRFERMREELGFTAIEVDSPPITAVDRAKGTATIALDPTLYVAAKRAGMAACEGQDLLLANMYSSAGRSLNGLTGMGSGNPEFRTLFVDAMRQYDVFRKELDVPVAVVVVDEPREIGLEAWHQNLAGTRAYMKMCREAGDMTVALTLMGDRSGGRNMWPLVNDCDVVSTHAWGESRRIIEQTLKLKKRLWFFNSGLDRYVWGFYSWAAQSRGCWQWHLYWSCEPRHHGGYPGQEWHTAMTESREYGYCLAGPLTDPRFKGGIILDTELVKAGEGITDYAYVRTLAKALREKHEGAAAKAAEQSAAFMTELRRAIPRYPDIRGLPPGSDGSTVGMGVNDHARTRVAEWRRTMAAHLKALYASEQE